MACPVLLLTVLLLILIYGCIPCCPMLCNGLGPEQPNGTFIGHGFCRSASVGTTYFKVTLNGMNGDVSIGFPKGALYPNLEDSAPTPFCYLVSDCAVTRAEAKKFCNAYVGQLVMINSNFQKQLIKDLTATITYSKRTYFTDIISGERNRWTWESSGTLVPEEFTRFKRQVPDSDLISIGIERKVNSIKYALKYPETMGYFVCQQKPPTCSVPFDNKARSSRSTEMQDSNNFAQPQDEETRLEEGRPPDPTCYRLSTCTANAEIARRYCVEQNFGDLVAIETLQEEQYVSDILKDALKNDTNTTFITGGIFLGNNANGSHIGWLPSNMFSTKRNVTFNAGNIVTVKLGLGRSLTYEVQSPDTTFRFLCEKCDCQGGSGNGRCLRVGYERNTRR